MKDIVIIGAGGIGREVASLIEEINGYKQTWNILGFLDDDMSLHNKIINGYKVFGDVSFIKNFSSVYTICAFADYQSKKQIVRKIKGTKIEFANIIHPSIKISNTVTIGEGVIIYPGVILTTNIRIGDYVVICPKCGVGHETIIKDYVSLLWDVNIGGRVILEEGCLIGSGSTIIQNKKIGRESIVGAGAVVIKDVDPYIIVAGCPARTIGSSMNYR